MTEKLNVQQQSVDLERLNEELEKIGLNRERLLQQEHTLDDRWLRGTLESFGARPGGQEGSPAFMLTSCLCQQVQTAGVPPGGNRPADDED